MSFSLRNAAHLFPDGGGNGNDTAVDMYHNLIDSSNLCGKRTSLRNDEGVKQVFREEYEQLGPIRFAIKDTTETRQDIFYERFKGLYLFNSPTMPSIF